MSHPDRPTGDSPDPDVPGAQGAGGGPEPSLTPSATGGDEPLRRSPGRKFVRVALSVLFVLLLVLASMTLIGNRAGAVEADDDAVPTSAPAAADAEPTTEPAAEPTTEPAADLAAESTSEPAADRAGTPFEFADSVGEAKFLAEGHYVSELAPAEDGAQEPKYVALAVPDGVAVHVSVVPLPEEEMDGSVILRSANSREECGTAGEQEFSNLEEPGRVPEAAVLTLEQDPSGLCAVGGWTLEVTGDFAGDTSAPVPVEMSVQFEEHGEEGESDEPARSNDAASEPVSLDDPGPVDGGASLLSAETITEGAFEAEISPGTSEVFTLPAQWGQQPVVTLRSGPSERDTAETVSVSLLNPLWEQVDSGPLNFYDEARERTIGADRPLSAANRDRGRDGATAVAGDYYVVVTMNSQRVDSDDDEPQPFEFAVELRGSPESGPQWRPLQEPGPAPSDVPVDAAGDPLPEEVLAEAEEAADVDASEELAAEGDDSNATLWGALFALGLIAAVGAVVFLGRRGA